MEDPPYFTRVSTTLWILHQIYLSETPVHPEAILNISANYCLPEQLFPGYHHPLESPKDIVDQPTLPIGH